MYQGHDDVEIPLATRPICAVRMYLAIDSDSTHGNKFRVEARACQLDQLIAVRHDTVGLHSEKFVHSSRALACRSLPRDVFQDARRDVARLQRRLHVFVGEVDERGEIQRPPCQAPSRPATSRSGPDR